MIQPTITQTKNPPEKKYDRVFLKSEEKKALVSKHNV
jgi:hypothetical protein